ncbi:prohead protease/major capsid protein fusion protein [Pelosinus baikalensis]|uniref:HK97 family phage prohead protease n=1 Tax=Pelosinus baikalensis TaxID=2892015 RepID=A0ABS8HWT6_9FIRM|nr:prohead protease/major capsid protein fusion protein [Pelosinus baikalensis]MCC5467631.1 HK97 family phage prohead protease [Pelosinus baikalensis]
MSLLNQAPKWANDLERSFNFERAAIDVEKRTVPLSFSSETTEVIRWGDVEILDHSPGAVDLTQLNDIGVLLFNHNVDLPIGGIESAIISDQRRGEAVVRFDEDTDSDKYFQKVRSGSLKAVSCRYSVSVWEYVGDKAISSDGRFTGPCYIARKWKPTEISIVSIPADSSVGVGRSAETDESRSDIEENLRSEINMELETEKNTDTPDNETIRAQAIADERTRSADIMALCRDFNIDPDEHIRSGQSIQAVQTAVLAQLRANNKPSDTTRTEVRAEDREKFTRAAADAILLRGGVTIDKPADGANELRSMRLRDLMIDCVERDGNSKARYLDDAGLIREALTGAGAFASILSNAANKSLSNGYTAAETTFELWTGTGSNPDFKEATEYKLSEAGELVKMTVNGEFKYDEMKDVGTKKSVLTFGRSWGISRQALINDDLGALTKIPAAYAAAAKRGINTLVYSTLGKASTEVFAGPKGNLAGTGSAPSVISIGDGRAAMRKQTNLRGKETLNIAPKYILIPTGLETEVDQLLTSITDPASSNSGVRNPFTGKLIPVCDAELDRYSIKSWYLAAQAGLVDTIEVTYLNGQQTPIIESQVAFDVLGMKWRIYIDYGVTLLDYRGLFKNPGE